MVREEQRREKNKKWMNDETNERERERNETTVQSSIVVCFRRWIIIFSEDQSEQINQSNSSNEFFSIVLNLNQDNQLLELVVIYLRKLSIFVHLFDKIDVTNILSIDVIKRLIRDRAFFPCDSFYIWHFYGFSCWKRVFR